MAEILAIVTFKSYTKLGLAYVTHQRTARHLQIVLVDILRLKYFNFCFALISEQAIMNRSGLV